MKFVHYDNISNIYIKLNFMIGWVTSRLSSIIWSHI